MAQVGIRALQQNAAAVLRRVKKGEAVEITERGRRVAVLAPAVRGDVLDCLELSGRLVRGEGDILDLGKLVRPKAGTESGSRRLARMRASER